VFGAPERKFPFRVSCRGALATFHHNPPRHPCQHATKFVLFRATNDGARRTPLADLKGRQAPVRPTRENNIGKGHHKGTATPSSARKSQGKGTTGKGDGHNKDHQGKATTGKGESHKKRAPTTITALPHQPETTPENQDHHQPNTTAFFAGRFGALSASRPVGVRPSGDPPTTTPQPHALVHPLAGAHKKGEKGEGAPAHLVHPTGEGGEGARRASAPRRVSRAKAHITA